jgi:hypothetical protein
VPAGAVTATTEFGIQPITNEAYNGVGQAYRVTPEGQTFAQPVQVTFSYSDDDLVGTSDDGLGIAKQGADGRWRALLSTTVDPTHRTLSVSVTQFGGTSPAASGDGQPAALSLSASSASPGGVARTTFWKQLPEPNSTPEVKVKESTPLVVLACFREPTQPLPAGPGEDELFTLPTESCYPSIRTGTWSVNGSQGGNSSVGTVAALSPTSQALYTAPASAPGANPVTVSGDLRWEARGVTKTFRFRVKVVDDAHNFHIVGSFNSNGLMPIANNGARATVSDRFEADAMIGDSGSIHISNIQNSGSQVGGLTGPEDPLGIYCFYSVDGNYEHITVARGEGAAGAYDPDRPTEQQTSITFSGTSNIPPSVLGTPTDNGCEKAPYPGMTADNRVDLRFDRFQLTEDGQTITLPADLNGWSYTIERRD